jgi:hypothetical protein
MMKNIRNEPALAITLLQAALAVGVSFGLRLSTDQMSAIVGLAAAASALLLRRRVSPVRRPAGRGTAADSTRTVDELDAADELDEAGVGDEGGVGEAVGAIEAPATA